MGGDNKSPDVGYDNDAEKKGTGLITLDPFLAAAPRL